MDQALPDAGWTRPTERHKLGSEHIRYIAVVATQSQALLDSRWGYRPHLDGVRAVAVLLVVLFHAGFETWNDGYVGVDVFFALSG